MERQDELIYESTLYLAFLLNPRREAIVRRKLWREACRPLSDQGSPATESREELLSFFLGFPAIRPKSNEGGFVERKPAAALINDKPIVFLFLSRQESWAAN